MVRTQVTGVALLLALAGCGPDPGAAAQPPSRTQEADVNDAAAKVADLGRVRFPDSYAGLEREAGRLVVYRTPSAAFDAALRELAVPVDVRDAPYPQRDLQALADRIAADTGYWAGRGITISSVGPLPDGTAVEVGTPQPDRLGPLLVQRYGPTPPVVVTAIGPIVPVG